MSVPDEAFSVRFAGPLAPERVSECAGGSVRLRRDDNIRWSISSCSRSDCLR